MKNTNEFYSSSKSSIIAHLYLFCGLQELKTLNLHLFHHRAIRLGDWKLIYYYKTGRKELYNIHQDISEEHDLSSQRPDLVRSLSRKLGKQLRKMNAQRPTDKFDGHPCPWPDNE